MYRSGCPEDPEACRRVRTRFKGYTLVAPTLPDTLPNASSASMPGSSLCVDRRYASFSASKVLMSIAEYLFRVRSVHNACSRDQALREDANETYLHVAGVSAFFLT